jgi:hypothetical protein
MFEELKEKYAQALLNVLIHPSIVVGEITTHYHELIKEHIKTSLDQMTWREFIEDLKGNKLLHILSSKNIMELYREDKKSNLTYTDTLISMGLPFERINNSDRLIYKIIDKYFEISGNCIQEVKPVNKTITTWEVI